jgi:hypothetical protein
MEMGKGLFVVGADVAKASFVLDNRVQGGLSVHF